MARQYYKDSTTGQMKPLGVKVEDTLPVGTEVDYDGTDIPEGWVEVDDEWHTLTEGCNYRKIGDVVNIQCWIELSTAESWANNNWRTIGTLPEGFRPPQNFGTNIYVFSGDTNVYYFNIILQVLANGTVRASNRTGNTIPVKIIFFNTTFFI